MYNIGIIGAGKMGTALFKALNKAFPGLVYITDHNPKKLRALKTKQAIVDQEKMFKRVKILILAIKPQSFMEFCILMPHSLCQHLVISILAGMPLSELAFGTGAIKVVRAMPNLPASVGAGFTGWIANNKVTRAEKIMVAKIFSCLGKQIELKKEADVNSITALSGSGPAYFFYLTELMEQKAKALGFGKSDAQIIAEQTFVGAAELMKNNKLSSGEWRAAVTSKGGTTEAALKYLKNKKFAKNFFGAIDAAKKRSEELSK